MRISTCMEFVCTPRIGSRSWGIAVLWFMTLNLICGCSKASLYKSIMQTFLYCKILFFVWTCDCLDCLKQFTHGYTCNLPAHQNNGADFPVSYLQPRQIQLLSNICEVSVPVLIENRRLFAPFIEKSFQVWQPLPHSLTLPTNGSTCQIV